MTMSEESIELADRVVIRGRENEGEYVVTQTRGTTGIISTDDLLHLNKPGDGAGIGFLPRGNLILIRKATPAEKSQFGW